MASVYHLTHAKPTDTEYWA